MLKFICGVLVGGIIGVRLLGKRSRLQNKQQGPVSKHRSRQQMLLSRQCIIP